mgnify:CR=1 FL=1
MAFEFTDGNFQDQALGNDGLKVVDFWAEWCGPCKILSPILDELQVEFKDKINIIKVNVDNNMDIAQQYNISNIPA